MEYTEDKVNNVAYLCIRNVPVKSTILFRATIFADLDSDENLVGIEIIDLEEDFPAEDFFERFPLSPKERMEIVSYLG